MKITISGKYVQNKITSNVKLNVHIKHLPDRQKKTSLVAVRQKSF